MANEQLMKAFQLMKDGEKGQATVIVKGVLREDSKNANALWLMSHLLDDEDEKVKVLQNILSIEPHHDGARKRLEKLNSRKYKIQSALDFQSVSTAKEINIPGLDSDYWDRLSQKPKHSPGKWEKWVRDGVRARIRFLAVTGIMFFIVVICFNIVNLLFPDFAAGSLIPAHMIDANGDNPRDVAVEWLNASFVLNESSLEIIQEISCDREAQEWADEFANSGGWGDETITIDYSDATFIGQVVSENEVTFRVSGIVFVSDRNRIQTGNIEDILGETNLITLQLTDNRWFVC